MPSFTAPRVSAVRCRFPEPSLGRTCTSLKSLRNYRIPALSYILTVMILLDRLPLSQESAEPGLSRDNSSAGRQQQENYAKARCCSRTPRRTLMTLETPGSCMVTP